MPAASAAAISPTLWPSTTAGERPSSRSAVVVALWIAKISGCAMLVSLRRSVEVVREQPILQRPAGERLEMLIDLAERARECRVDAIGGAAHAGPLAAVAGIDEGRRRAALDGGSHDETGRVFFRGKAP